MENEKRYTIDAALFKQLKDVFTILNMPHIIDQIKAVDILTAKDVIALSMELDRIATLRHINDAMRKLYRSGDAESVNKLRDLKVQYGKVINLPGGEV